MSSRRRLSLMDIPWEDVFIPRILPYLSLKDCCNIRSLDGPFLKIVQLYLQKRKVLTSDDVEMLTDEDLQSIASMTRQLRILDMTSCPIINTTIVQLLIENNNFLSHINLSNTKHIDDTALHQLIHRRSSLRVLELKNCHWVTHDCVATLLHHLSDLECVDLRDCPQIPDLLRIKQYRPENK